MRFLICTLLLFATISPFIPPLHGAIASEKKPASHEVKFKITNSSPYQISIRYQNETYFFNPNETKLLSLSTAADREAEFVFTTTVENKDKAMTLTGYKVDVASLPDKIINGHIETDVVYPGLDMWPAIEPFTTAKLKFTK